MRDVDHVGLLYLRVHETISISSINYITELNHTQNVTLPHSTLRFLMSISRLCISELKLYCKFCCKTNIVYVQWLVGCFILIKCMLVAARL